MKNILRPLGIIAACAASYPDLTASPSGLANPGFETVLAEHWSGGYVPYVPGTPVSGIIPGWGLYVVRTDGSYAYDDSAWSLKGTLAGWAEPVVVDRGHWFGNAPPLEGEFSVGFQSGAGANELSSYPRPSGFFSNHPPNVPVYAGRAGIYQTVHLPGDITELTCYYVDLSFPGQDQGSLVLSFNNQVLGYTLEPTLGPHGSTTLLRADLTPVAGQSGKLHIGIEGMGFFVVDNIVVVPEAPTLAGGFLVALGVAGLMIRRQQGGTGTSNVRPPEVAPAAPT